MELTTVWFLIVGVLLIGYFVLDGFDFGVGIALPFVSKDDTDRRVVINTIGPVWDLNETWLIVAGACLFAAFPEWYATMFAGFYLPLLLILLALILRGVSFEYRHQGNKPQWKAWFDNFIFWGSVLPPLLWGVAFANLINGLPVRAVESGGWIYEGTLFTLLNPYSLLGGVTVLLLCFTHGLVYLALKSEGEVRERARHLAVKVGAVTILAAAGFLVWTIISHLANPNLMLIIVLAALAAVSLIAAWLFNLRSREGWAFASTALTIAFALLTIFAALFPHLMISNIDPAHSMTVVGAASTPKTLQLMTWVAVFTLPFVLAYQAWTFWIFRKRISRKTVLQAAH
ncbi:cytochrome d ubiquinol oxidase subunit II [Canibacter oris]|uniref:Cytochrome d ubiquinol oxidase subunit II n=1 Tax=Canibacter oris TaxID=1365628 RepID=A0A840DJR1_9MICO|nr:cytochrome d ubiquinol oxidase subunit II [Canibacter oris]MBB4071943.1 cytochrome d ubiquinol oxidase subunit II [Canibacter oris]